MVLVSMGYEYSRLYAANLDKRLKETLRNQSNINGGGLTPNRRNSNRRDGPDGLEINTSSNAEDGLLNRVGRSALVLFTLLLIDDVFFCFCYWIAFLDFVDNYLLTFIPKDLYSMCSILQYPYVFFRFNLNTWIEIHCCFSFFYWRILLLLFFFLDSFG